MARFGPDGTALAHDPDEARDLVAGDPQRAPADVEVLRRFVLQHLRARRQQGQPLGGAELSFLRSLGYGDRARPGAP